MNRNYPSDSIVVRNLADLRTQHRVLEVRGRFRIVELDPPYFDGYPFWVINEKGFLWEPAGSLTDAVAYLDSDEAADFQLGESLPGNESSIDAS